MYLFVWFLWGNNLDIKNVHDISIIIILVILIMLRNQSPQYLSFLSCDLLNLFFNVIKLYRGFGYNRWFSRAWHPGSGWHTCFKVGWHTCLPTPVYVNLQTQYFFKNFYEVSQEIPQKFTRNNKGCPYSKDHVQAAFMKVRNGTLSLREASVDYAIPLKTLS